MYWARYEQVFENTTWIANNQRNILINLRQDFMASAHSDFFQGQMDRGLFYWPHHSGETHLSKLGEKVNRQKVN